MIASRHNFWSNSVRVRPHLRMSKCTDTSPFSSSQHVQELALYPGLLAPAFVACSTNAEYCKRQTLWREGPGTRLYKSYMYKS